MDTPSAPIPSSTPQPVISSPAESPNRHWVLWSTIGLTFLIFGIALGIFGARFFIQPQAPSQLPPAPTQSPTPTPIPAPTTDWKTYSNNVYLFSLKYPSEWKYLEVPNSIYETKNNEIWFTHGDFPPPNIGARADIVFIVTSFDPSADWEPKYFDNYRSIAYQLGNITAKKITGINKEGLNQEFVIIARIGNYYLQVMPNQSEESLKNLDQILSTFKFTN